MNNHLGDHAQEEMLNQTESKAGLGPVVAPFQNVEHVAIELHLTIKVLLLESFNGDLLLAVVCLAVFLLGKLQIVFDGLARQLGLLVLAGCKFRGDPPEGTKDGETSEEKEEDPGLEAHAHIVGKPCRDADNQADEAIVGKRVAAGTLCRKRSIGNRGVL